MSDRIPLIVIFLVLMAVLLALDSCRPYDSTDDRAEGERSGLSLYTDHLTGCQYLEGGMFGGLTPRRDGQGNHVGCKDD